MNDEINESQPREAAIYALAPSPAYPTDGLCFAASGVGLLVSHDGGLSFSDAYASLALTSMLPSPAVAVSPQFASDRTVFAGVHGAVMRSLDGGATWAYSELRTPAPVVTCLAVSPAYEQDGIVFAGSLEDGVFRSADRGGRWASWNFGLIDLGVMCLALSPSYAEDETLVVGTETGIFRSTNGGRAWRELGLPTDLAPVLSVAFSPDYARDGILVAGTESNGLWISKDRGRSWETVEALGDSAVNALVTGKADAGLAMLALAEDQILISRDAGTSWQSVPFDEDAGPICLAAPAGLAPGAPLLIGCSDGAVRHAVL
jgi:photosystem II stability/assembly factor-like uncharacterized protein